MDLIPRRVVLGLVENDAFVGVANKSPFSFKPFNIRSISVNAMGVNHPAVPYNLDFTRLKNMRPFQDLHNSLGLANSCDSNGITLQKLDWMDALCL